MSKKLMAVSTLFVTAPMLVACGSSVGTFEEAGFNLTNDYHDTTAVSEVFFDGCENWVQVDKGKTSSEKDDIFKCSNGNGLTIFMYKGVYADSLAKLKKSKFYKTKGKDKSDVYVDDISQMEDTRPMFDYAKDKYVKFVTHPHGEIVPGGRKGKGGFAGAGRGGGGA